MSPTPLRFDEYVERALYDPDIGFFATGGGAGRRGGDFITSVEVGPLFGAVLARWLDALWDSLGRPQPLTVIEAGAGRGALAISVRSAQPRCAAALHWILVERSAALRARHGEHLVLGSPPGQGDDGGPEGPWFTSADSMPAGPILGAVVANELLDNLPFRLLERTEGGWDEVWVQPGGTGTDGWPEVLLPASPEMLESLDRLVPGARPGDRVPLQLVAADWVRAALGVVERGAVLLFDYSDPTESLARRPQSQWLRTYRGHERGGSPLEAPGSQDITVEVARDQLPGRPAVCTQADWLRRHGIEDLVERARLSWRERASVGDLAAMRARSVPVEAAALLDPDGLGAFSALEWAVP